MKNVELRIATAVPDLCRRLEQLGLATPRKKGHIVVSSDALAQKLQKALSRYCFKAHSSVKTSGTISGCSSGRGRKGSVFGRFERELADFGRLCIIGGG
eukprot:8150721-Pyramimonas_sp.AAC.1